MPVLDKFKAVLGRLFPQDRPGRRARQMSASKENGTFAGARTAAARDFERDYDAASRLLKGRMNATFPDAYHARLLSGADKRHDPGARRAQAVDTMSIAIAAALRDGANVQQAADAGAASVGI